MGGRRFNCIIFAGVMVILRENRNEASTMLEYLNKKCEEYGMEKCKKRHNVL